MTNDSNHFDIIVIGSGPAGQNAAIAAAECDARVLMVEREQRVGGACVQYGTIPSKTLRETAVTLSSFQRRSGGVYNVTQREELRIESLMCRLHEVLDAHQTTTQTHLDRAGITRIHGHAKFVSSDEISIENIKGERQLVTGDQIIIATGSRPNTPPNIPVDHENILDSDSILSLRYLPRSLTVLGGGVIACEYASIFACLGVQVTIIDRYPSPLGFLDEDLVAGFVRHFHDNNGRFLGNRKIQSVEWDRVSSVLTTLDDGNVIFSDKLLVAQGRVANVEALNLSAAGINTTDRGLIAVNDCFQSDVANIYAVGDAIGYPALASCSMEQGRRAARYALQHEDTSIQSVTPMGIYTIPEIACVGLNEAEARREHGEILVGRVCLSELARGQIVAASEGLLKIFADPEGKKILGVQILGDGATELIHLGQMAMLGSTSIDKLSRTIFNFPTLAEGYRLAALDIIHQRENRKTAVGDRCDAIDFEDSTDVEDSSDVAGAPEVANA